MNSSSAYLNPTGTLKLAARYLYRIEQGLLEEELQPFVESAEDLRRECLASAAARPNDAAKFNAAATLLEAALELVP